MVNNVPAILQNKKRDKKRLSFFYCGTLLHHGFEDEVHVAQVAPALLYQLRIYVPGPHL